VSNNLSLQTDSEWVRPLKFAENQFLQVLLTSFAVRQGTSGLALEVEFDYDSPAIWLRRGRTHLRSLLSQDNVSRYQADFEDVLLGRKRKDFIHNDPAFPFRFGNGGTLPVIRIGDQDYFCLFYREIPPVGWNIANGGAENVSELLDPLATIERELREELFIVEPRAGHRYVFDWNEGRRADHPDFGIARRVWQEIFRKDDFAELKDIALPLKWLHGHDSVIIRFGNEPPIQVTNCILNINAEDFGIEIDRIAKLVVGPDAILCDGEVVRGKLLNRVIGLFEVRRFKQALLSGNSEFIPDRIFYGGKDRSKSDLQTVVNEYLDGVFIREVWAKDVKPDYETTLQKFGLCPVTRNLIRRFLLLEDRTLPLQGSQPDVFLSFASEDIAFASQVHSFLRSCGNDVFFSEESVHESNFGDAIDRALKSAKSMVVVGTETRHFFKPWVRYEWQSFHNDILAGRKPWNTSLVTLAVNPDHDALPRALVFRRVIAHDPATPDVSFQKLGDTLAMK
jgi:hypothetical protein